MSRQTGCVKAIEEALTGGKALCKCELVKQTGYTRRSVSLALKKNETKSGELQKSQRKNIISIVIFLEKTSYLSKGSFLFLF